MKRLIFFYVLLLAVILIGCQKESAIIPESKEIQDLQMQSNTPITTLIAEGVDLKTHFNKLNTIKTFESRATIQEPDDMTVIHFYYDADDFDCNFPTEDFEDFNYINQSFPSYLDEFSNNNIISPGDILSGISFETPNNLENGLFICNWDGMPNVLMSNNWNTDLVIRFTTNTVSDVSMNLYNLINTDVLVLVYNFNDEQIGSTNVYTPEYTAQYLAISSVQPIKKIVITSENPYGYEGVDFIGFGSCSDADGDGCPNEEDPYPNSIMTENIIIDGIDTGVENTFENCGTMADEIQTIINQINSQYTGDNYYTLHKKLSTEVSKLTYYWVKDRKITRIERSKIGSAIWSANIPLFTNTY
ncbi:hypothetical protein [Lutibacter sp.]|uniref:hypothetical protein n=1 Tax=Lutibacter sp. TaxID=1925666 RepID=UPI001A233FC1|nr:hypothetical protein [Lutibacter sp.]MBI9041535.1 hypothetical protein [Lutibacter sp.]